MGRVAVGRRPLEHPLRLEQAGKRVCPTVAWGRGGADALAPPGLTATPVANTVAIEAHSACGLSRKRLG